MKTWLAGVVLLGIAAAPRACETGIEIDDLWIRQSAMAMASAAGFFRLHNNCEGDIELVSVTSPRYGRIELHQSIMQGGQWTMHQRQSVSIAAGETVVFQSGDLHLMLMEPAGPVEVGDEVPLLFHFADGREFAADAEVRKR